MCVCVHVCVCQCVICANGKGWCVRREGVTCPPACSSRVTFSQSAGTKRPAPESHCPRRCQCGSGRWPFMDTVWKRTMYEVCTNTKPNVPGHRRTCLDTDLPRWLSLAMANCVCEREGKGGCHPMSSSSYVIPGVCQC